MNKLYLYGAALLMSAIPQLVSAAAFDEKSKFLCAAVDVMECLPGNGCQRVSSDDVDIPSFFKVDVKNKNITTSSANDKRKTKIERVENIDGKLVLQGAEDGRDGGEPDGVGWTMAVTKDRGNMILTASGDGVAFVVFGACTSM